MNYAGFVSGLRASLLMRIRARRDERGRKPFCRLAERSGKSSDIGKLIPGSAMVLFFHCSFPEHNSYRFA
jgi:hypothetical protein